jgi:drug/metabolite transporter (DMT)-like permease
LNVETVIDSSSAAEDASSLPVLQASELLAKISLASSQLLVGTTVISARYIVEAFPVLVGLAIRQGLATFAMLLIRRLLRKGLPRLSGRAHAIVFAQALTGVVLFNLLLMLGVDRTTATTSGIITSTVPAAIALLSLALGERISRITAIGIVVAMSGVLIANTAQTNGQADDGNTALLGGAWVMGAVICEALFTILGKSLGSQMDPLQNCLLVCLYGVAMLIPLALWQLPEFDPSAVPASGWIAIVWSAGPVMIGGFFLWFSGLRVIPANRAAVYTGLIPVSALVCSFVLLGEQISWQHLVGMSLAILAVFLVARTPRSRQAP